MVEVDSTNQDIFSTRFSGRSNGGPPFHILDKKQEMTEGRKASKSKPGPLLKVRHCDWFGFAPVSFILFVFYRGREGNREKMGKVTAILVAVVVWLICR